MTATKATKLSKSQRTALDALPSKSAKIRYLTSQDWTRRQIADELGIIYQYVWNVQNQKAK